MPHILYLFEQVLIEQNLQGLQEEQQQLKQEHNQIEIISGASDETIKKRFQTMLDDSSSRTHDNQSSASATSMHAENVIYTQESQAVQGAQLMSGSNVDTQNISSTSNTLEVEKLTQALVTASAPTGSSQSLLNNEKPVTMLLNVQNVQQMTSAQQPLDNKGSLKELASKLAANTAQLKKINLSASQIQQAAQMKAGQGATKVGQAMNVPTTSLPYYVAAIQPGVDGQPPKQRLIPVAYVSQQLKQQQLQQQAAAQQQRQLAATGQQV